MSTKYNLNLNGKQVVHESASNEKVFTRDHIDNQGKLWQHAYFSVTNSHVPIRKQGSIKVKMLNAFLGCEGSY